MAPRKRKAPTKYKGESPVKRVKSSTSTPTKRTSTPRAAKVNRNDPEWLVTSEKSPLAYDDLHAELCDPKTYENFTLEDWSDLAAILPDEVPHSDDGSISLEFFKYNPDFRRGIREFQEDLATGRLEPAWQAAAAEAMEDRARGNFDTYKEKQFEEFWGQKQKLDGHALAGESAKLKLDVMIQNGVFKEGDIFSYYRVTRRVKDKMVFEKDCTIVAIGSHTLKLMFPPGQLKYSRLPAAPEGHANAASRRNANAGVGNGTVTSIFEADKKEDDFRIETKMPKSNMQTAGAETNTHMASAVDKVEPDSKAPLSKIEVETRDSDTDTEDDLTPISTPNRSATEEDVILHEIKSLQQLETRVLEIDGRVDPKSVPAVNAWRFIRCKRNNQDLGTLFEMREEFYIYKYPQIVKSLKKKGMYPREGN